MTKQLQQAPLSALPDDHYLQQLYTSPTFKWLKIEMEGNQEDYEVDMEQDDDGNMDNMEPSDFLYELFERTGYSKEDFKYILSYNDGSVDTEVTFTVPLTPDGVAKSKNMLTAFGELINDTEKAGMHITLMGDDHYKSSEKELSAEGLKNLERQLTPILPWLQLLSMSTDRHRGAYYCTNTVGKDKDGYPAINVQSRKRIEFRSFHVCYYNVEMLNHYLEVISRMLEYYEDPSKKVILHGGTGTYRVLQGTDEFNAYLGRKGALGVKSLAFSDIFHQFTGKYAHLWKEATRFEPVSFQKHFADKTYREGLKGFREQESIAKRRLTKEGAKWLTANKGGLYDTLNQKAVQELM